MRRHRLKCWNQQPFLLEPANRGATTGVVGSISAVVLQIFLCWKAANEVASFAGTGPYFCYYLLLILLEEEDVVAYIELVSPDAPSMVLAKFLTIDGGAFQGKKASFFATMSSWLPPLRTHTPAGSHTQCQRLVVPLHRITHIKDVEYPPRGALRGRIEPPGHPLLGGSRGGSFLRRLCAV